VRRPTIAALACAIAAGAFVHAQTAPPRPVVVVGCVSRQDAKAPFVITDARRTPPAVYRLDGDPKQLALHVGHTLEVAGSITPGPDKAPPVLKVSALIWISKTCAKPQ
jgi:hypothetical protein